MVNITRITGLFILNVLIYNSATNAQGICNLSPRFDQEIFTIVNKSTDVVYGANADYQGANMVLKMDIYQPDGDTMSQRPLIIFAHGGSFVAGDKSNGDQVDLCNHFAKRGYICATINYRLGMAFPINAATATDAVYRSVQDMKAAIRFFRKDAATNNTYKINPNIVIVGGTSAGAFTAMHLAYLNTYPELPATIDTAALGNLDGNSGNPGYPVNVNAVINLCGALGNSHWVIPGDPPLVSMHGTTDATVPYSTATLLLFNLYPLMPVDGSFAIHNYINTFSHPAEMYTWYGQGHVPFSGNSASNIAYTDTAVRFVSNFLYKTLGCIPADPNPLQNTFSTVGIANIQDEHGIHIGSNPVIEEIELFLENNGLLHISLWSVSGQQVYQTDYQANDSQMKIEVKNLPNGLYFLHYKGVNKSGILKVIIQHN